MKDSQELASQYYDAARSEIVLRLSLREQVLLAGVAAFGVIFGFIFNGHPDNFNLFLVLPALSFAFLVLLFRHNYLIRLLGEYLNKEVGSSLQACTLLAGSKLPLHWDAWLGSRTRGSARSSLTFILIVELIGAFALLWLPGFLGFLYAFGHAVFWIRWADGILLAAGAAWSTWEFIRIIRP